MFVGMPSAPEWLGATSRFWYRTTVAGGSGWHLVDAATSKKSALFDHARLAAAVSAVTGATFTVSTLPFTAPNANVRVAVDVSFITFNRDSSSYRCDLALYSCSRTGPATVTATATARDTAQATAARPGNSSTTPVRALDGR